MTALAVRRLDLRSLGELAHGTARPAVYLTDDHRLALAQRFRATSGITRRRLEAWHIEGRGTTSPFHWTPRRARRSVGRAALRRYTLRRATSLARAAIDEVDELLVRAKTGSAAPGSLAHWLLGQPLAVHGAVAAHAATWATTALVTIEPVPVEWTVCEADAFYDVAGARTTLRGRRDLTLDRDGARVLVRFRSGQPGPRAGTGLRADLAVDALSQRDGAVAQRIVGLWPDAGLALSVEGTLESARRGARALVAASAVQQRALRAAA